jgi:putative inorganic carbon (HCO3(-)) transporter
MFVSLLLLSLIVNKLTDSLNGNRCSDLRNFPARALTITLFIFIAFVPLAYSPHGAEYDGIFDDFYYQPKLIVGLFLLALAAIFRIILTLQNRMSLKWNPLCLYVGAFLAALAIATILSPYPRLAFWGRFRRSEGLLAFIMYAAAFFLFATSTDSVGKLKIYIRALLIGACIAAAYGLLQFFDIEFLPRDELRKEWWRAFATSGNPAFLSAHLLLVLPFPVLFFLFSRKNTTRRSLAWLYVAAVLFSCILATYHRGAWVGLAAGAILGAVMLWRAAKAGVAVSPGRIAVLIIVFAVCAAAVDRSAVATGKPSLFTRAAEGTGEGKVGESTIRVRTYVWRATLPLIFERPAFGWGPDTMREVFPEKAPKPHELGYTGRLRGKPDKPENLILQIAYEGGLAALTPFLIAVGLFLITMWRAVSKLEGFRKIAALGILIGSASYLAQQQFSFSTLSSSPIFWSLMGLGIAITGLKHTTRKQPQQQAPEL